jgi:hypothetical protein
MSILWQKFKTFFNLDYEDVPTSPVEECYHYSAPLPDCEIKRCYEERVQQGKRVLPYCVDHYRMIKKGIAINCVCENPSCDVNVLDSNSEFCTKHR